MTVTAAETPTLTVAEVYAAHQGEGPSAGVRCAFVRLGGCNLTCGWARTREEQPDGSRLARVPGAWACDEPKTWHAGYGLRATLARRTVPDILAAALALDPPLVVITGGEPLIHQDQPGWAALLAGLLAGPRRVEIETNGTIIPALVGARVAFNVSPKLANSGVPAADRVVPAALRWHARCPRSAFKLVCATPADVAEAAALAAAYGVPPSRTWIMPEGITPDRVLAAARAVAPAAAAAGFNLTLRQHVLVYGEEGEPR